MKTCRTVLRLLVAIVATLILAAAAPIHAAHGHEGSSPASTMHASCVICQMHAPVGTPAGPALAVAEPRGFGPFILGDTAAFQSAPRSDIDACRAPPFLLV